MINAEEIDDCESSKDLLQARKLVMYLEDGNIEKADLIIRDISMSRENDMFHNLGKLTRDLHDAMNDIGEDSRLNDIMHNEMPEARHSLSHVIALTENAANTTLSAIEHSSELIANLSKRATYIRSIQEVRVAKLTKEGELSHVEEELKDFIDKVITEAKIINKDMSDIVVAQGYQDLSGQLIQRVSKMVHDVEHSLVAILKISSQSNSNTANSGQDEIKNNSGYGPVVPGVSKGEVLSNQDEVDDLLSTLGF